jgi:hypothetical protein
MIKLAGSTREAKRLRQLDVERAAASARIERYLETFAGLPLSVDRKVIVDRDELYDDDGRFGRFD